MMKKMKVVILSDTHGYNDRMWKVLEEEAPYDMVIHCGDLEGAERQLRDKVDVALHMVAGNNDYSSELDRMQTFRIGNYKVLLTHGHRHRIYSDISPLYYLARANEVDMVIFGHLHVPVVVEESGVTLLNPGSLTYPRQENRRPSYMIMTLDEAGVAKYDVKYCR